MPKIDSDAHSAADHGSSTMIDVLRRQALRQGSRLAYTFLADGEAGKVDLTYGELDRRSQAIGASLQLAGAPGRPVLLLYPHGLEFITAFWGCLYAGAIAVPVYPPRLNRSQLRLRKIIEDTGATMALTTKVVKSRVDRLISESPYAHNLTWMTTDEINGESGEKWREPDGDGGAIAMIQYTSGSTSAPKGVMVSHRNLLSNERMIQEAFGQTEESIIVGWLPLYHDMGLIGNVLQPLFLGARCVLMSPTAFLQKPSRWLQAISDYRGTTSGGPNFAYDLCVRKIGPDERARLDLSSWAVAFNGAEPIFHETMERFAATFAACGFRREAFYPCYGLAEATLLVSAGRNEAQPRSEGESGERGRLAPPTARGANRRIVGCGRVLPDERVIIVNPETLTPCPAGRVGEIWVSGPNVAGGYWNRKQETEQTFGAILGETGACAFLRTGDLGYVEDDQLFVAGRIKDLIIIRGRNHYPQDIELTVQQADPSLEAASCAAFSIEQTDEERLVIVGESDRGAPDPDVMIERIREAIAREHEVQAYAIALINKGSLPRTTSGKIQRYECRDQYLGGRLSIIAEWRENLAPAAESAGLPPANRPLTIDEIVRESVESSLLSFLAAKLRRVAGEIGLDKPLLSYGVDSLTAVELSHHLESRFGVILPSASVLEDATVAQLAQKVLDHLKGASSHSRPTLTPLPQPPHEYPLSHGQRSLWFLYQMAPLSGVYNVSSAVRIRSALDRGALRRALKKIVGRHDSLRTVFLSRDGEPLQRVQEKSDLFLSERDISSWSDQFLNDHLAQESQRPFNLEQGPLLRVSLFTRAPEDHVLLVVAHHIVVDLWSLGVLIHELGLCYRAEVDFAVVSLGPLPVRYADYVYWQSELLASREGERLWTYWRNQLVGDVGMLNLPADRPRPSFQTFRGGAQPVCLSPDLTQALKSLGQSHGATLYMTLQAIFLVLLHRYTAQEDILIGSPMACRNAAELSGVIGYFVNPVVLRADLSGDPIFSEFLDRVRETTLAAIGRQDYPFALLVERLQPARDPSRSPLFQVMFALQQAPSLGEEGPASQALVEGSRLSFGGLSAESIALPRQTSYFDLSLFVVETAGGLKGFIECNADLFDEWRIRRMAGHLRVLAEAVTAHPGRRIHKLELMSAEERAQVIVEFNRTGREYERSRRIHELFEQQVESRPESVALICEDQQLTFAELNSRANRLAHHLRRLGVGPETLVGVYLERGMEMVVGLLGILKAGGAYVPLDPAYPVERIRFMLEDSRAIVALTQRRLPEAPTAGHTQVVTLDAEWRTIAAESEANPASAATAENLAYVIYTSGSTGRPKGVLAPHHQVFNFFTAMDTHLGPEPAAVWLAVTSISFDISVLELLWTLARGFQVVVRGERRSAPPSPDPIRAGIENGKGIIDDEDFSVAAQVARYQVSHLQCTPSMAKILSLEANGGGTLSSLRKLMIGGEAFPIGLAESLGRMASGEIRNMYGPTETTIWSATYPLSGAERSVPIGRPIANTQIYILDWALQVVPVGVPGELYIGGEGVVRGYLRRPDLTAERFLPDPFGIEPGARFYRTGDVARHLADGKIEFLGRIDHQVKIRGFRIEPGEIEVEVSSHPGVRQCVVVAHEGETAEARLVGYVVCEEERAPSAGELRRYLKERLPEYMAPASFVMLEQMPLTPNGKVDRRALPAPEEDRSEAGSEYTSSRRPVEEILVGIFGEVLKLNRVGIDDDFFELGGHSLLATRVVSRVRKALGVEIGVRNIFEEPTAGGLAVRIEAAMRAGEKLEAPPLVKAKREGHEGNGLPLSYAQRRLWFIEQLAPGNTVYNCPGAVRLEGRLDLEILEDVINEIVKRHETLRTRIEVEADAPVQVIDKWIRLRLERTDLSQLETEEKEEEVRRRAREEARTGFDLSRGPLLRMKVLKLAEEEHVALFTMHHIVSDAWSIGVLAREVCDLYEAISRGETSPLPELEIQYADYAVWQREYLGGEVLENEVGYWKEQLKDAAVMNLPVDHTRPAAPSYRGGKEGIEIRREVSEGLERLCRREGATLFMVLMAAFKTLLLRYSGEEDVSVGTVIANRTRREVEGLIGFFANTLVMRTDLSGNPSFKELIEREREVALGAYAHQEAPFEKLVEEINPERDLSRSPLFQVMMVLQNAGREDLEIRGLKVGEIAEEIGTAKFDLTLTLTEGREGIAGGLEYGCDLYERETIRRMARHYERVLEEVVRDAEQRIREIELMSEAENRQIVEEWNETGRVYEETRLVHELVAEQARRRPEGPAVKCGQKQVSYRELNDRANHLAHYLRELGVGPEVVVGVFLERSIEMVVGLLGILKAGGAYVPIDTTYPDERLKMMVEDAGIRIILTQEHLAERCSGLAVGLAVSLVCLDRDWDAISARTAEDFQPPVAPDNAAYVIYTSGSTGKPKGVIVTHRSVMNLFNALNEKLHFDEDDVWTMFHSYAFDFSVWEIWGALIYGGTLVVVPYLVARVPEEFCDLVNQQGVTILSQTPSAFRHFMKASEEAIAGGNLSLRAVVFGGEPLEFQSLKTWLERHGDESPRLINMYGITETTVHTTYKRVTSEDLKESAGSVIGRPLSNMRMYVLDERMQPAPVGVIGELYVAGNGMARGYLGRESLTAERFRPTPNGQPGERIYKTGDLARYLNDGTLEYVGRKDLQVKIRGYRIELGEIESALLQHEAISEAVVMAIGEAGEEKRLVAYLVSGNGEQLSSSELRTYLSQRLPDYMTPAAFMTIEKMPLTANGKLNRHALPSPAPERGEGEAAYVAPLTPVEEMIVGVFEEILKVDRVGREDNFFELGGHSLLATLAISRIREVFGVEIGVRAIFDEATVEGLACRVEEALKAGERPKAPPLVKAAWEGHGEKRLPLSFAQQRLWFLDQLAPNNPFYNVPGAVRLDGRLDLGALESVINEIIRRHEALRTKFEVEAGEPVQVIGEWKPQRLERVDLASVPRKERAEEVRRRAVEEAQTGFDLSRWPLLRVKVLKLAEEEHVLLLTMSHIVSDGWSMGTLVREVRALYEAMSEGKESPLPDLEIQYADYAVWQREYLTGEVLENEVGYWKERLKGAAILELPTDHPRPAAPSYRGAQERVELGREMSEGLRRLSRREGATLFMVLMAAFKALLMRYSGEDDLSVGTSIANRTRREVEGLIGFFANTLVLRTDLGGNPSFRELVRREREVCLGAYARQEVPFEKLVEEINPHRDLSRNPLFQVMMELQNTSREELEIRGLKLRGIGDEKREEEIGTAKFDLILDLTEVGEGVAGSLEYSLDLYQRETIRRMARQYEQVVREVVRDAEQRIRGIDLLRASEREQILVEWNETEDEDWRGQSVEKLFEEQVEKRPEAMAVVCGDQGLSYRELNESANRMARALIEEGVGPEVVVGLLAERGMDFLITLLAIFKAGGTYLPLDPHHPVARIGQVLKRSGAGMVITTSEYGERAAEAIADMAVGKAPLVALMEELRQKRREGENVGRRLLPRQLAYVIFTSGSTGAPKGAMVEHGGMLNHLRAKVETLGIEAGDIVSQTASQCFDISVWQLLAALLVGGAVRIVDDETTHEPGAMLKEIEEREVTIVEIVPSMMRMMLSEAEGRPKTLRLSTLRWMIATGEALPPDLCRGWLHQYPEIPLLNAYGPTECSDDVTHCRIEEEDLEGRQRSPIGRPIVNTQIYVLNEEFEPQPVGIVGELYIGGAGVGRGYEGEAVRTAESFVPAPYGKQSGGRMYKSGDLARYLSDGKVEYVGRRDDQIKLRGYRIELGEIEAALGRHEGIREVAVEVKEDGRGEKRLVAYLVAGVERAPSSVELREYLKRELPEYMAPGVYVRLEGMPLTENGKLDRRRLPGLNGVSLESESGYEEPRTETERKVAGIWSKVLGVEKVGVNEDFFELGGHSLLATQAISRVREEFGVEMPLREMFERPRVKELAKRIDEERGVERWNAAPKLVRVERKRRDGEKGAQSGVVRMPLSYAQRRLWFLDQLAPNNPFYNIPGAVRLEGKLDLEALEGAISEIVRRHESLRTRIEVAEGAPVQVIDEWKPLRLEVRDLTIVPRDEREVEVRMYVRGESETGFDLRRGPLLRVKVIKLDEDDHVVLFTMHHIISDGWSMGVLLREVSALYEARREGREAPLPELEIQYADYAVWQREYLTGETLNGEVGYWKEKLKDAAVMELPSDHPRPAMPSYRGRWESVALGQKVNEGLRKLSQREGVTLFMALMAAFKILLMRYSGEEDLSVGTVIANRTRREVEGLIGFFVNTLVMRTDLGGNPSFRELVRREREVALGAYAHQELPFEKLVEEINPRRDLSRNPLFQVMMALEIPEREALKVTGPKVSGIAEETVVAKFDLTLWLTEGRGMIAGGLEYSRDLYEGETVRRMARHFERVVEEVVRDSEQRVREIELMSEAEKRQIVEGWNETDREYDEGRLVYEQIAEQARRRGEAIAVESEQRLLSYRELERRSNQLGNYLRRKGVGPEDLVGICADRSVEMVIAMLGVLKTGAAYLPIDASYPDVRVKYMLEVAEVEVLLAQGEAGRRLKDQEPTAEVISLENQWEEIIEEREDGPDVMVEKDNLAYVIYTSGSTGRPKGVMVTHKGLCNLVEAQKEAFKLGDQTRVLQFASLSFDASVWEIFSTLASGGSVRVPAQESLMAEDDLARVLREDQITMVTFPPTALAMLAEEGLPHLQTLVAAGEACGGELVERWAKGRMFLNAYGPTEATVCASMGECRAGSNGKPAIGRPIANTRLYTLDRELKPVPVGVQAELHISGAGLARGYVGRPDLTAERFLPNPLSSGGGERLYLTGDVCRYLSDGKIEFVGRADEQVKIRGYRIELGEIEAVLNEHPSVRQSVVIACDDERGSKRLLGYVVGEEGTTAPLLKRHVRARLPEYMVPEAILVLEGMPVTANGKIDRKRLPLLKDAGRQVEQAYVRARTPVEELMVDVFEEVLRLDRVGVCDNFFEIGGHSLLATQVVSRVRSAFGVEIEVRNIFEDLTVEGLARRIEKAMGAGENLEARLQYWKKRLGGKPPGVNLAGGRRDADRPPLPTSRVVTKSFSLPSAPYDSLKALSKREGATLLMVLLAAFKTLLHKYTSESDVIVGTAVAGRNRAELGRPIDFFMDMLPLRTDLSGNPRFTQLLKRLKEVTLSAYVYRDLPFDELIEEIQPERESGRAPLFNVAFGAQNATEEEIGLMELNVGPMAPEQEPAKFDLMLWVTTGHEAIQARWIYRADLFEEARITLMHSHFETLLSSIVARPDARLDELETLSEAERTQQAINRVIREEYNYSRFKTVKPKAVALSED